MKGKRMPIRNLALALQGMLAITPSARETMPTVLATLKPFFGLFRLRGG